MSNETPIVPSVGLTSCLKLRPSVAVVTQENYTEFFLSDIRKAVSLSLNPKISNLLFSLDGKLPVSEWITLHKLESSSVEDILNLLRYLNEQHVLLNVDLPYPSDQNNHKRLFAFLENYSKSTSEVLERYNRISSSSVMIIGLGAVGTWVAQSLVMSGVRKLILVDPDLVEVSNLHRQVGFVTADIGRFKVEAFRDYLLTKSDDLQIQIIQDTLDDDFFVRHPFKPTLIINSADYPTVDETSRIVGAYAMEHGIAHCIGGGYNLHQTLIGQIIIPGKTACVECFRLELEDINVIDTSNIKRLDNPNRKIGSFPPLSALSASITSNEAVKYLAGLECLSMANCRTEFSLREMDFSTIIFKRRPECKYCGKHGIYYRL